MAGAAGMAFVLVGLIAICAGLGFVGVFWALSAWFDRRLRGYEAALLVSGMMVLMCIAVVMTMKGSAAGILLLVGALACGLVGRVVLEWMDQRHSRLLDEEDVAKYREALAVDPNNVAAHSLLAEIYRQRGNVETAMEEYEAALRLDPSLKPERYWLERLRSELDRGDRGEMACPRCGTLRTGRETVCQQCGRWYSTLEIWGHAFHVMPAWRKTLWTAVGAGALTICMLVVVVIPGGGRLLTVLALFAAAIGMLIVGFLERRRRGQHGN